MLIAPGRVGLARRRRPVVALPPGAPGATTAFAGTPKAGFRRFSDTISALIWGFDFGYNQQGAGAIALVDDPAGINGKVIQFTADTGSAAYVAEQFRFGAHNGVITDYAAMLVAKTVGHRAWRLRIPSGSGTLFSAHASADTTQATEQFSIGFVSTGPSTFRYTVNGTAVGRDLAVGWQDAGISWDAGADTLALFTRLDGEGAWTTERSGAITAFAAPSSIRTGLWTATGAVVQIKQIAWSDTSFAEIDRDFAFAGSYIAFTDQNRMSANLCCPDGMVTGATQARLRTAAGDDPSVGATGVWVPLTSKSNSALPLALAGLTHNTNFSSQFEYGDAAGNVLKVSAPYLWGTLANPGTAVSAQYAAHCCYESTTAGHPFREIDTTIAQIGAGYRKLGAFLSGDLSYEHSAFGANNPYRTTRPNETEAHFQQAYREFHTDLSVEVLSRRGPLRIEGDDHETINNADATTLVGGANANVEARLWPERNTDAYTNGLTLGTLTTRGLKVVQDWVGVHNLHAPAGKRYGRIDHGNITIITLDVRYGRVPGSKYIDDDQWAWVQAQIAQINSAGTAKLVEFRAQAGLSNWISKDGEGWHNIASAQGELFKDLAATLICNWLFASGDVHLGHAFHTFWNATTANPTRPASFLGEYHSSGGAMLWANSISTNLNNPTHTKWKGSGLPTQSQRIIRSSPTMVTIGTDAATIDLSAAISLNAPTSYNVYTAAGDTTAPTISSANPSGGYPEMQAIVGTLTANETVTWTKTGTDAGLVTLNPGTGVWSLPTTDFETKTSYSWTFTATDGSANATPQNVAITITDVDEIPDAFAFTDVTNATVATVYESNTITVAGLASGLNVPVAVSGGEYSKNGEAYTGTAGTAANGDTFKVRHTSSGAGSTAVNTALTIGGGTDTYTTTTAAGGGGYTFTDTDAAAYVAAMTVAPTDAKKAAIDSFVIGLKADGIWAKRGQMHLYALHNQQAALLNVFDNGATSATAVGTLTHTAGLGLQGNESNSYIDLGRAYGSIPNVSQNSLAFGAWCNQQNGATGSSNGKVHMGTVNDTGVQFTAQDTTNDTFRASDTAALSVATTGSRVGHRAANRSASNARQGYRGGVQVASDTQASAALPGSNATSHRRTTVYTSDRLAAVWVCGSLTSTEHTAMHNRLDTLLTALAA